MTSTGTPARQLVGIDVGGTFTDFVWWVDGRLIVHKIPTTPADQSRAVVAGLEALGVAPGAPVVHGTTVATNALLERRGARTALVTTEGFADVLAIGRQDRPHLYRLSQERPPPLVPAAWRFEVPERLDHHGRVLIPLDEAAVERLAARLREEAVESVAVVLLFSFRAPAHERRIGTLLRERCPGLAVSLSSDILPEYREYERTATTVASAYVQPLVARYLTRLGRALGTRSLRVMQSNGGTIGAGQAAAQAARLVLSGPAGGVVGAMAVAARAMQTATPHLITFDMGGTSTDVALCPGAVPHTAESVIDGVPLRLPAVDIHTVGAGGGSIARVDAGGVLRVGPESAGADPGPVCYGRGGTAPTVTDANLVLGRLHPGQFLAAGEDPAAGEASGRTSAPPASPARPLRLDPDAAHAALARLGERLGRSAEAAALGVLRVANATMERALRRVSVERGHDPAAHVLVPFGGAGPLHACDLAAALGIRRVLVPPNPGVLSALGLLLADVVYDASQAVLRDAAALVADPSPLRDAVEALRADVCAVLEPAGTGRRDAPGVVLSAGLDLRYAGQSYELEVPLALPVTGDHVSQAVSAFHEAHARRYGHARPEAPVEVVTLRVRGTVPGLPLDLPQEPPAGTDAGVARLGTHPVWFGDNGPTPTPGYDRARLRHGHRFEGPAIVFQYDTTVVVPPGWAARVDAWRNLWVERQERRP
ncbi:hydantoinase/oxoprolinase family protein [Rhodocaloribacter litoris]|uniref:hydantoinase/oxoprolinase family protein n=1 Tax=Rhodocaloribacter litoris TaxID=2558931 RepID=UPI00141E2A1A|nr:hydantoinase/oxoprolinase family protein [Rhodocaloribacter litoris]QXD15841.1 hydantoinase/oxoprolinase family protein [Rhodocaloribacter litoris]